MQSGQPARVACYVHLDDLGFFSMGGRTCDEARELVKTALETFVVSVVTGEGLETSGKYIC